MASAQAMGKAIHRADCARIWSLTQLERQLRPEAYARRRGGYLDRRQIPAADIESIRASVLTPYGASAAAAPAKLASNLLHAIHGMPSRPLLLTVFAAGQRRIMTARPKPPLSRVVLCFMPRHAPGAAGR
jgi:hypothetical protein